VGIIIPHQPAIAATIRRNAPTDFPNESAFLILVRIFLIIFFLSYLIRWMEKSGCVQGAFFAFLPLVESHGDGI
jgi:hypothetical protein